MKIRKFLSILLACMLLGSLLPSAEAIDCAIYDAYAAPASVTAHPAENAGPRSFMTAKADEAAEDGVAFHPYVFTVDENASVSAAVRLQPALMVLTERAAPLTGAAPDGLEDGSNDHPYLIGTKAQLEKFRDIVNKGQPDACAVLTADIDLENAAWTPISDYQGSFDGAGHVISGLNVSGGQYAGLFGTINEGSVHQLGVQGSVSAEGAQNNGAYAGGIVGYSLRGTIDECWFNGTVSASCSENGSAYVGGIVGSISSGGLSNCYSLGAVHAESAYNAAYAGGIAGYCDDNAAVSFCYHAEGNITAAAGQPECQLAGGIVGNIINAAPVHCYYLTGTANSGVGDGSDDSASVTWPLSADKFGKTESFIVIDSAEAWDFAETWYMNPVEGRPRLRCGKQGSYIEFGIPDIPFGVTREINFFTPENATGSITVTLSCKEANETFSPVNITDGKASLNITPRYGGNHTVTAAYSGDDQFLPCEFSCEFRVVGGPHAFEWDELQQYIESNDNVTIILAGNLTCNNQTLSRIEIPKNHNVTIDLRGFAIDRHMTGPVINGSVISVARNSNLTIIDSAGGGAITGGRTAGSGGAIYVADGGNLTLRNVSFTNNTAGGFGGAIFLNNTANTTVENVTFSNNSAGAGGAVYTSPGANLRINNCTFCNNSAVNFGAIVLPNTNTVINRSSFINNTAQNGVIGNEGDPGQSSSVITNCIFVGNEAGSNLINITETSSADSNWFGSTADNYQIKPVIGTLGKSVATWFFMNLTRTIDDATGQYAFGAALELYNSTSTLNRTTRIAPEDYPLQAIVLDGSAEGADIDVAEASGGIHLLTRGGENNAAGAVLVLSPEGYSSVNFTPSVNSTNYTLSFRYPGHPEIYQNLTYVRTIRVTYGNDEESLRFNETGSGAIATVNLTALENEEAIPNAVLENKTVSVAIGNLVSNFTISRNGVFEMDPGDATPGSHDALLTVAGFVPLIVKVDVPKRQTPLNVTAPEYVVIGDDVTIQVNVPENATGNVTLNIRDGAGYDETFCPGIGEGVATASVPGLQVGAYTVNITYPGDDSYLNSSASVSFRIVEKTYTVALSASPTGGGGVTGAGNHTGGTNVTVTAAPNPGYDFVSWKENGEVVSENASYVFPAIANRTLTAVFARQSFAVSFVGDDGTSLRNSTVFYGETPEYNGKTPTKAATAQYTFTFAGWSPALGPVTEDTTYTATYSNTTNKYTVRFLSEDGYVLSEDTVAYGETPQYTGAAPTKAPTQGKTWTFLRWDPALAPVTGAQTYYAVFSDTDVSYTIRFLDSDGAELQSAAYKFGETPTYNGTAPTKAATAQYTFTFAGWTPEIAAVTGNATYTATYSSVTNKYTVRFLDEDGYVLSEDTVAYGETPEYSGETPAKAEDEQYTYSFAGWTPEMTAVTGNANYTATFKATEKTKPGPEPSVYFPSVVVGLENFKRSRTYGNGTFSDVDPTAWYFENVVAAYEFALMDGMGDGTFGVGVSLKLSEALALACRMHSIYYGGSGKFDQTKGETWYAVYEDYAVKHGIIQKGEYDLTKDATRAQFAAILSAALPDAALKPINDVKTLPDMKAGDPRLPAILRLYNAGILTGVDEQGNFRPDAFLPREQIAAMATRVADPALRKAFTLS